MLVQILAEAKHFMTTGLAGRTVRLALTKGSITTIHSKDHGFFTCRAKLRFSKHQADELRNYRAFLLFIL